MLQQQASSANLQNEAATSEQHDADSDTVLPVTDAIGPNVDSKQGKHLLA